jgi:hypothetical protein
MHQAMRLSLRKSTSGEGCSAGLPWEVRAREIINKSEALMVKAQIWKIKRINLK